MEKLRFRGKVKYNGNHYFSGDSVEGYCFKKGSEHYIIDDSEDDFGNVLGNEVEVFPEVTKIEAAT